MNYQNENRPANILLIILATLVLISCEGEKKDYMVISGKIKNYRKGYFSLEGFGFKKKIKFDRKTKLFSDTIRGLKPGHYFLKVRKIPIEIYLDSTQDIKLKVDAKKRVKPPKFYGPNKELIKINKYLVKKMSTHLKILGETNKLFAKDEKTFLKKMIRYRKHMKKLLEKYKLPKDYSKKEERNILHVFNRNLNNYENYHGLLTGNEKFKVSPEIIRYIKEFDLNNEEDYKFSFNYRKLLEEYINHITIKNIPDEGGDIDLIQIDVINENIENKYIRNQLLYNHATKNIPFVEDLKVFYTKITSNIDNEEYIEEITDTYNKLKLTAKGQPSPKFFDLENFDGGTTSLDDLLGKGKYLYIDLWATWCGYCKKEIPLLKNVEEKYNGKNVEFVSISVDEKPNHEIWKNNIKDKEMGGIQLFAGESYEKLDFAKKYLISGLPRFILLDPEGKIITPHAPRPSDGYRLDDLFEKYNIGVE